LLCFADRGWRAGCVTVQGEFVFISDQQRCKTGVIILMQPVAPILSFLAKPQF